MDTPPSSEPDWARGSSLSTSSSQFGVHAPRPDGAEGDDTPASGAGPLFASTHTCGCRPGVLFTPPSWLCQVCGGTGATPHTPPSPVGRGSADPWLTEGPRAGIGHCSRRDCGCEVVCYCRLGGCSGDGAAPPVALPIAQALVIEMGAEPIVISETDRKVYFEAISVANNFSKMIVNQSIGLLESVGVDNARVVLGPLIRSAVEEALAEGHTPLDPEELLN